MNQTGQLNPGSLSRLLRNFGWKLLAEGLSRGLSVLFFVLLARSLGDTAFGLYSLPLATAGLLAAVLDPGANSLLIREVARHPVQAAVLLRQLLAIRWGASGLFALLLIASWPLFADQLSFSRLLAGGAILLGQSWLDTQIAWLNAHHRFAEEASLRFWLKLALLLPPMLVLWLAPDIDALLWASAAAHLICLPWLVPRVATDEPTQLDPALIRRLLHEGLGFWLANLAWMLTLKLDLVMLPLLGRPAAELGWYQAAIRFYELLGLGGYLLSMAALPRLATGHTSRRRLLWLAAGLGLLSAVAGAGGSLLLPLILGQDFGASQPALWVLSLGMPAVCLNLSLFSILGAAGRQRGMGLATLLALLANLVLNLLWIPIWGYLGAAYATLATDYLLCGLLCWQWLRLGQAGQTR